MCTNHMKKSWISIILLILNLLLYFFPLPCLHFFFSRSFHSTFVAIIYVSIMMELLVHFDCCNIVIKLWIVNHFYWIFVLECSFCGIPRFILCFRHHRPHSRQNTHKIKSAWFAWFFVLITNWLRKLQLIYSSCCNNEFICCRYHFYTMLLSLFFRSPFPLNRQKLMAWQLNTRWVLLMVHEVVFFFLWLYWIFVI